MLFLIVRTEAELLEALTLPFPFVVVPRRRVEGADTK